MHFFPYFQLFMVSVAGLHPDAAPTAVCKIPRTEQVWCRLIQVQVLKEMIHFRGYRGHWKMGLQPHHTGGVVGIWYNPLPDTGDVSGRNINSKSNFTPMQNVYCNQHIDDF